MRRIVIVLAVAAAATTLGTKLSGQTASANLSVSASVSKNCTITTAPVAFGAYDPVVNNATAPKDGTGSITVTCTQGAGAMIGLDNGQNGPTRRMSNGAAAYLTYDVYTEATHTTVWGAIGGTPPPLTIGGAPDRNARTFTVYGRVPGAQSAPAGSYTDTLLAVVNF